MAKYKEGDRVNITTSDRTGVIRVVYESGYWNMSDTEYAVELDDGSGSITIIERVLNRINEAPKCECGVGTVGEGKHSSYCPLYNELA